jgi:hypothetical protein
MKNLIQSASQATTALVSRSLQALELPSPTTLVRLAWISLGVGLVVVIVRSYIVSFSGRADAYCLGEWLINYGGGFVRRGLGGTAILQAAAVLGVSPRLVAFAILAISYALIFYALAVALARSRPTILDLVLILSPCAAFFPVIHDVAGQRKEVLMLAMMSLVYLTDMGSLRSVASYAGWAVAFSALIAINDGAIFFLPIPILMLRVVTPSTQPVGLRAAALAAPALSIFVAGYLMSSHIDINAICASTERYVKGPWCMPSEPGRFPVPVSWLRASAWDGLHSVTTRFTLLTGALTITVGILGLLPVLIAFKDDKTRLWRALGGLSLPPRLYIAACVCGVATLFVIANDWNRWFYILTSLLTLMHFTVRDLTRRAGSQLVTVGSVHGSGPRACEDS